MERDFLGLGSKNLPITVKEEVSDSSKDSAAMRGSGIQWSFSNKVSAIPQFLSFKNSVEEKPRKTVHDAIPSSGFMPISTGDAFNSNQKPYSGVVQKNMTLDKQGLNHHAMATYDLQHFNGNPVYRPLDLRAFSVSNQQHQTITVSAGAPILQSHFAPIGHNIVGSAIKSQPLGGVPIIKPISVLPATSPVIGTTDVRNGSKPSGAPAQLTIFYAGSVCVYDDVSPEKAQAIMLLAGNGSSTAHNKMISTVQVQASNPGTNAEDCYIGNKSHTQSLCSVPSPISVTNSTNELAISKSAGILASSNNQTEPPKVVSSGGPASGALVPSVAVPQARKASLARFLEKRKERVTNASPYNVSKKSPDSDAPGCEMSLSINSSGLFPLPASN